MWGLREIQRSRYLKPPIGLAFAKNCKVRSHTDFWTKKRMIQRILKPRIGLDHAKKSEILILPGRACIHILHRLRTRDSTLTDTQNPE